MCEIQYNSFYNSAKVMNSGKIEVFLQNRNHYQLVATKLNTFLIFSLKKAMSSHYQSNNSDDYQTFLLVKSFHNIKVQPNIGFIKLKEGQKMKQTTYSQQSFMQSESYYSSFLRHINLSYCQKVSELLQTLNLKHAFPLANEWLILYEVHNFKFELNQTQRLIISPPIYGEQVQIYHQFTQDNPINQSSQSQISNFFRQKGQNFYFLSQPLQKKKMNNFDLVCPKNGKQLYGLVMQINQVILCLPFHSILFQKSCEIKINEQLMSKLKQTCYIQIFGSYCSGIRLKTNQIISTRHVLPISDQVVGTKVFVRLYPYNSVSEGTVTKIGTGNFDIIEITLFEQSYEIKPIYKNIKEKKLQKHHLTSQNHHLNIQKELEINDKIWDEIQQNFEIAHKQAYPKKQQHIDQKDHQIGSSVTIFGFGKYSFSNSIFNKFQIILPTISTGIISKLVKIKDQTIFIKTDAKLYNGFSGSGIWGDSLKGMAVFILKNKNSQSHYNRHNFSYQIKFIQKMLSIDESKLNYQNNSQLQEFDKIQTRKKFKVNRLPLPKL